MAKKSNKIEGTLDRREVVGAILEKREDALVALNTGVHGIDVVIGTSPQLMQHSHGKDIRQISSTHRGQGYDGG